MINSISIAHTEEATVLNAVRSSALNLDIQGVGKQYTCTFWGLRNFNLNLTTGVLGLLGPNGAGKSTLMRMLATITKPTTGRITWNGVDISKSPDELRAALGYLPQDFGVYPRVSAYDMLDHMAVLKGVSSPRDRKETVEGLLHQVNLWDVRKKALAGFSGGMRRPGTAWADVPEDFVCPECGVSKEDFEMIEVG